MLRNLTVLCILLHILIYADKTHYLKHGKPFYGYLVAHKLCILLQQGYLLSFVLEDAAVSFDRKTVAADL